MRPIVALVPLILGLAACTGPSPTALPTPETTPSALEVASPSPAVSPSAVASASSQPVLAECRTKQLRFAGLSHDGAGGTYFHIVRVTNTGSACRLRYPPRLVTRDGVLVPTDPTAVPGPPLSGLAATINRGQQAEFTFLTSSSCADGRAAIVYRSVRLVLRDGGRIAIGEDVDGTCGVSLGEWRRAAD